MASSDPPSAPCRRSGDSSGGSLRHATLRGIARLATDATLGVTRLVEAIHAAVQASVRPGASDVGPHAAGLTGWIYAAVRQITWLSGRSAEGLLHAMKEGEEPAARPEPETGFRLRSVLNGIVGDHLAAHGSPLARSFSIRGPNGEPLNSEDPGGPVGTGGSPLVVFVHGLCRSDRDWAGRSTGRPGPVEAIPAAVGGTPALARYNTGRSIRSNGQALSDRLTQWGIGSAAPPRIIFVAHSMGGLVDRSAIQQGRQVDARWVSRVTETVYLGTPHRGAPLERAGAWVEHQLRRTRFTDPFTALTDLRSRGIQDLRNGLCAPAGTAASPSEDASSAPTIRSDGSEASSAGALYVAGALAPRHQRAGERIGDGLVPLASALDTALPTRRENRRIFEGLSHMGLVRAPAVTEHICQWLTERAPS